jgi:hypothetical protein
MTIFWSGRSIDTCPQQSDGSDELDSPAFGSSHVSTHTNLWSEFPRSDRSSAMRPLQINDPDSLRDFGSFRPRPDQRSFDLLLDQRSRSPSGLRRFHPLLSSGVLCTRVPDLVPRVHFQINDQDLLRLFLLLLVHKLLKLWILRHLSSLTMDGPKSLRDFGTLTSPLLLCTQGLSLVRLPLDPTVVGPSRSDLTDGICSSPLRFLCSVGR